MSSNLRAQKLELLAALQEKRKRLHKLKPKYKPTPGQSLILASRAKNIFNFSGNGGGKTTMLVQKVVASARGVDPFTGLVTKVPAKIIVVVDNSRKIDEKIIPEMRKWFTVPDEWLKRLGKPYTSRIEFDNGSQVDFYSADADPDSFEGIEATDCFVDEPISRRLYIALKRALRLKGYPCRFMFCGTAISERWLRVEVYDKWKKGLLPNTECFTLASSDNKENQADGWLEEFGASLSEAEKEVRLNGGFFETDSLALAHLFKPDRHIIPQGDFTYKKSYPCVVAVDPHTSKPHHAIMICATEGDRIIAIRGMKHKCSGTEFAAHLKKFCEGYTVVDIVCDSAGNAEGTALEGFQSFIDAVRDAGVSIRPTTYKEKSHEDLLSRMQNALAIPEETDVNGVKKPGIPKLRFLSHMKGPIEDIEQATWQKNRITGETIMKIDTGIRDNLSCLGYALATNLFADKLLQKAPVYKNVAPESVTGTPAEVADRRKGIISNRNRRMLGRHRR